MCFTSRSQFHRADVALSLEVTDFVVDRTAPKALESCPAAASPRAALDDSRRYAERPLTLRGRCGHLGLVTDVGGCGHSMPQAAEFRSRDVMRARSAHGAHRPAQPTESISPAQ